MNKLSTSPSRTTSITPRLVRRVDELRAAVAEARVSGHRIGLVPTMGALHDGHLSLVRASQTRCSYTIVTIFVNPTQFAAHEDLGQYPRTLEADLQALGQLGVELVFAPHPEEVYPENFSTFVEGPRVALPLEGIARPDHFRGVTTVVLKLLNMSTPDMAFFGQKDYQQALVIRHMIRDLNLPLIIQVCPIVRDADGLAMSSRNAYLSDSERSQALALSQSLAVARRLVREGEQNVDRVIEGMQRVFAAAGIENVDYIAVADPDTLEPRRRVELPLVVAVAARVGSTRLIDNCILE